MQAVRTRGEQSEWKEEDADDKVAAEQSKNLNLLQNRRVTSHRISGLEECVIG